MWAALLHELESSTELKKKMEKATQGPRASIHPFLLPGPPRSEEESQPHTPVAMDVTVPSRPWRTVPSHQPP